MPVAATFASLTSPSKRQAAVTRQDSDPPRPTVIVSSPSPSNGSESLLGKVEEFNAPELHVNGRPQPGPENGVAANGSAVKSSGASVQDKRSSFSSVASPAADGSGWGANFWVTLADPEVRH